MLGSIIVLFKLIYEYKDVQCQLFGDFLYCLCCDECLLYGLDVVKGGCFNYYCCLQKYGWFIIFVQFMIEKGFVWQLIVVEIGVLSVKVGIVCCIGCGVLVDICYEYVCGYCCLLIVIFDLVVVEQVLVCYQQVEVKCMMSDVEVLGDVIVMCEKECLCYQCECQINGLDIVDVGDLIVFGVELVWKLICY